MKEAIDLVKIFANKEVLVLGKGPSLQQESFRDASTDCLIVGINQTAAKFPVNVAFFIDIEPFYEIADFLLSAKCAVVLPWHPNQRARLRNRSKPMSLTLLELLENDKILKRLDDEGRLYYFHSHKIAFGADQTTFQPNLVSLTSLIQLLAKSDVKVIKTLGVDGGQGYSNELDKSNLRSQLKKGYDKQFPILREISISKGLIMERANEIPLNVYIGCESPQRLVAKVLEHSILRNTMHPVRIKRLNDILPVGRCLASGRTPFSMQRFFIPELNAYNNLAIYLDSDMLLFSDIYELLSLRDPTKAVSSVLVPPGSDRRPQFSVMVIDCAAARWNADEIIKLAEESYDSAMFQFDFEFSKSRCIPHNWNSLEHYDKDTSLLHFTDMDKQPWIATSNRLAPIWMDALFAALSDQFISFDDLVQDVQRGWLRPGILWQVEHGERDPLMTPRNVRLKDSLYSPPHTVARFTRTNNKVTRGALAISKRLVNYFRGNIDA